MTVTTFEFDTLAQSDQAAAGLRKLLARGGRRVADDDLQIGGQITDGHVGLVAMVGHSVGGQSAAHLLAVSDRISAAVNLDGSYNPTTPAKPITKPFMMIGNPRQQPCALPPDHPGLRHRLSRHPPEGRAAAPAGRGVGDISGSRLLVNVTAPRPARGWA